MEISKFSDFSKVKESWKELFDKNSRLTAYQSDKYAGTAFSYYMPHKLRLGTIPVFYEITENGRTIMIIPLCRHLFKNEYTLFGYRAGQGYLDFIYSEDISPEKMGECISLLLKELKGSRLIINRLREDSLLYGYLAANYEPAGSENCVCINLPASYDEYLASLSKHSRHHVRTAYNRLESEHKVLTLKTIYKQQLQMEDLRQMVDLYCCRRKEKYNINCGFLMKQFLCNFDIPFAAMQRFEDYIHFILYIDGEPAAFYNGMLSRDGRSITVPRLAIDCKFSKYSPGILILNESIKKICGRGIAGKLDLMQGDERYKLEMGGEVHQTFEFVL